MGTPMGTSVGTSCTIGRLTGDSLADSCPSSINAHSIVASKSQLKSISGVSLAIDHNENASERALSPALLEDLHRTELCMMGSLSDLHVDFDHPEDFDIIFCEYPQNDDADMKFGEEE